MLESLDALIGFCSIVLALSLLVTTLVQLVQNWLNMRGSNLAWSLAQMFRQMPVAEGLRCTADEAEQVARELLRMPGIAVNPKRLGKAVDPDLIPLLLEDLALGSSAELAPKIRAMRERMIEEQANGVEGDAVLDEATRAGTPHLNMVGDLKAVLASDADEAVRFIKQRKDRAMARFDHFMTAARERFQRKTQLLALGLSLLLCIAFRVDALQILADLRSGPVAVSEAEVDPFQHLSVELMQLESRSTMREVNEGLWDATYQAWLEAGGARLAVHITQVISAEMQRDAWQDLISQVERQNGLPSGKLLAVFEAIYSERLTEASHKLQESYREIRASLDNAPVPVLHPRETLRDWKDLDGLLSWLLSGILVALGAPFWFNLLRQLMNLRPVLSQTLDPKAKPKKSGDQSVGQ